MDPYSLPRELRTSLEVELARSHLHDSLLVRFRVRGEALSPDRFKLYLSRLSLHQFFNLETQMLMARATMGFGERFSLTEAQASGYTVDRALYTTISADSYLLPALKWESEVKHQSFDSTVELYLGGLKRLLEARVSKPGIRVVSLPGLPKAVQSVGFRDDGVWIIPGRKAGQTAGAALRDALVREYAV